MTGKWFVRLAIGAQRARDITMPSHADSPAVMYALVTLATTLMKWASWEGTPICQVAPHLCLFITVIDRLATMALGAFCLPDTAYLDRPDGTTPHGLDLEMQAIQSELDALVSHLARWRSTTPAHLGSGFDRLSMAAIQCIEEFRYFETAGILTLLSNKLQAIEATINEELNRMGPALPNPRVCISPSSDSDGRVVRMGGQALNSANQVLMARAVQEARDEDA